MLLNANRNAGISKAEVEAIFTRLLGVKKTIWLPGDPDHVTGDMTDGHVDGVCASPAPARCWWMPPAILARSTPRWCGNRRALELATDARGRHFEMLELFEASDAVDTEAEVFCASYTNFYIANGAIIMPAYGIDADDGRCHLRLAFPGRDVVPVRINQLAHGGGGVHHQQQPAWPLKGCEMAKLTVATTQMPCSWNLARNLDQAERLVREAAARGAQVILLQELFATPTSASSRTTGTWRWPRNTRRARCWRSPTSPGSWAWSCR